MCRRSRLRPSAPVDLRTDLYALGDALGARHDEVAFEAASDIRLLEMVRQPSVVGQHLRRPSTPGARVRDRGPLEFDPSSACRRRPTFDDSLEAVPATASVDRAAIARCSWSVSGDKLDKEQKLLPVDEHVYGEVAEAAEVAREVAATVTSIVDGGGRVDGDERRRRCPTRPR